MLDAPTTDAGVVALALGAELETGLNAQQAFQALHENGPNELCATPRMTAWRRLLRQFQDPLIYLLLAAIAIALLAWVMDGSAGSAGSAGAGQEGRQSWPVDAIVIAIIVLLNSVLGFVQEAKAESAVGRCWPLKCPLRHTGHAGVGPRRAAVA